MAGKDCIRACFFLLFVALAVGAPTMAPPPSCIERIHKIFSRPGGRNLMGGWRDVETPQNDATVKDIVVSSLNQYNNQPNNSNQYQLFEDGNVEAYSQVRRCLCGRESLWFKWRCINNWLRILGGRWLLQKLEFEKTAAKTFKPFICCSLRDFYTCKIWIKITFFSFQESRSSNHHVLKQLTCIELV